MWRCASRAIGMHTDTPHIHTRTNLLHARRLHARRRRRTHSADKRSCTHPPSTTPLTMYNRTHARARTHSRNNLPATDVGSSWIVGVGARHCPLDGDLSDLAHVGLTSVLSGGIAPLGDREREREGGRERRERRGVGERAVHERAPCVCVCFCVCVFVYMHTAHNHRCQRWRSGETLGPWPVKLRRTALGPRHGNGGSRSHSRSAC